MHEPGDRIAQKYRVERLLDRGGMGEVYVCINEKLGKRVAIKLLDRSLLTVEGAAERFTREAIAASAVRHRGVVEIYDADVLPDGRPWIAMELLEGESLQARLDRERIIPADDAISIASDVLDVLAAVHGAGIVHRDLKPGNLFLERLAGGSRRVKVLDFGIAKVTSEELGKLTRTGTSMGTPHYFAPEQATAGPIDARTDLYAMGVVIFEMLTGDKPYVADNFGELVRLMYTQGPRSLSAILPAAPPALVSLIDRCLSVDPARRPSDARTMRAELIASVASPAASHPGATAPMPQLGGPAGGPAAATALWPPAPQASFPLAQAGGALGGTTPLPDAPPLAHGAIGTPSQVQAMPYPPQHYPSPHYPHYPPPHQAPQREGGGGLLFGLGLVAALAVVSGGGLLIYRALSGGDEPSPPRATAVDAGTSQVAIAVPSVDAGPPMLPIVLQARDERVADLLFGADAGTPAIEPVRPLEQVVQGPGSNTNSESNCGGEPIAGVWRASAYERGRHVVWTIDLRRAAPGSPQLTGTITNLTWRGERGSSPPPPCEGGLAYQVSMNARGSISGQSVQVDGVGQWRYDRRICDSLSNYNLDHFGGRITAPGRMTLSNNDGAAAVGDRYSFRRVRCR